MDLGKWKSARVLTSEELQERKLPVSDQGNLFSKKRFGLAAQRPPLADDLEAKAKNVGLVWDETMVERSIPYWASDERVDGHGDIVRQKWDFGRYAKNPVIAWNHEHSMVPIGKAIDWSVLQRSDDQYSGPALALTAVFAPDADLPVKGSIFNLIKAGFLKGGSVGFLSHRPILIEDAEERKALGLGKYGLVLEDNELLEFSATTIGSNSGAFAVLNSAKKAGLIEPSDISLVRELLRCEIKSTSSAPAEEFRERDAMYLAAAKMLWPSYDFEKHRDVDQPFEAGETRMLRHYVNGSSFVGNTFTSTTGNTGDWHNITYVPYTMSVSSTGGDQETRSRLTQLQGEVAALTKKLDEMRELLEGIASGIVERSTNGAGSQQSDDDDDDVAGPLIESILRKMEALESTKR